MMRAGHIISPLLCFPKLTRRQFIAGIGATALAVHPLLGCNGSNNTRQYPKPKPGDTYFTQGYELSQTQSAEHLATFMETDHSEYDLNGWFFFGSLVDSVHPDDIGVLAFSVQRVGLLEKILGAQQVPVGVGFNSKSYGKWEFWGFYTLDVAPFMTVTADPWNVTLLSPFASEPPLVTMQTVSGRMGQVDTVYLIKADIPGLDAPRLKAEVRFRDRFGVINQGYGTAAFCVQNITGEQREMMKMFHGGSAQSYLESTGDPMICQGDYYYQMPFLEVEEFSIMRGDTLRSKGTSGLLWADVLSASYDEQALKVYKDMLSTFFAIQFPEENIAMMVLRIDSANGSMPIATLYSNDCERTRNSARKPLYSWPIDGIKIEPDPESKWVSPVSQKTYYLQYRIQLESVHRNADLTIKMVIDNQEVVTDQETSYPGLGSVEGTLDGHPVTGQVFLEVTEGIKQ
ncbi:MAG: hypothetical protein PHP66_04150 [Syntrophales bacterium]|nr:hypothetical protein [Syntrophales bacterium]